MELIYSKLNPDRLLHIIYRERDFYDIKGHRLDIVGPDEFLQLSSMNMKKGHTFKPHQHIWRDGEEKTIAQESWVVIKGSVECHLYDTDSTVLMKPILYGGDCSVTLGGGHTYLILEDDTLVYEYKTGPYKGIENDKVMYDE